MLVEFLFKKEKSHAIIKKLEEKDVEVEDRKKLFKAMMMEQKDLNILLNKVLEVMEAKKECAAAMEEEASAAAVKTEGKTKGFITITVLLCMFLFL